MSEHRVDVVAVKLEPHGNADSLSIVRVAGFTCVVRTCDWHDGQLAAYIEPDMMVPANRPEFTFLVSGGRIINNNGMSGYRVRVKRLRGVMSMGLLIPAPLGAKEGDNVIDELGVARYEPQMTCSTGGERVNAPRVSRDAISGPIVLDRKYDVESAYRYKHLLCQGEEIVATEKVHGANARFVYVDDTMYCGSRSEWKREDQSIAWWKALAGTPELREFCEANPGITVYGEIYGQVQDLKYGASQGQIWFAAFDLLRNGEWIDHDEARELGAQLPWVPVVYRGPWIESDVFALADGDSIVAFRNNVKQLREGIVVKPVKERRNDHIGRTQVKIVSNQYLEHAS